MFDGRPEDERRVGRRFEFNALLAFLEYNGFAEAGRRREPRTHLWSKRPERTYSEDTGRPGFMTRSYLAPFTRGDVASSSKPWLGRRPNSPNARVILWLDK